MTGGERGGDGLAVQLPRKFNPVVVIPTWNRAEMIGDAVESVLAQSVPTRVVVVDDGSTDGTADRLRSTFADEITLIVRENAERGAARNTGAAAAPEASHLLFLDADDRLHPEHVSEVARLAALDPAAVLLSTRVRLVDEHLKPGGLHTRMDAGPIQLESFLEGSVALPPSCCAVPRIHFEGVGGFDEDRALAGSEDWLLHARLLLRGSGVRSAEVTVDMRKHTGNSMAASRAMERAMRATRDALFGRYRAEFSASEGAVAALERSARYAMLRNLAATHYGAGEMKAARASALEAAGGRWTRLFLDPDLRRSWLRSWLGARLTGWLRGRR